MAPINQLGYGVASLNILKALQKEGVDVGLSVIGQPQITTEEDAQAVRRAIESAKTFDNKAPCIKIWHQNDMAQRIGSGRMIGFPIFELDTFSDLEKHHLSSCDELMVCSQWAKDVVMDQCPPTSYRGVPIEEFDDESRVHVVPLGVDAELFPPAKPNITDKTVFLNCGKWEIRKGHDILIESFKRVAEKHDNVELWMMCTNPFNSPEEEAKWTKLYDHPKVKLIPRMPSQREVYNIMTHADCGVFPSRGEGWNLELLEMMAIGRHVIATNYSAHTEFCNEDNCKLLPIKEVEPAFDGKWFFEQGNWAKLDDESISELETQMINFHTMRSEQKDYVNQNGIETANNFSWQNTAKKIIQCLQN